MRERSLKTEFLNEFLKEGSECKKILDIAKKDNDLMMFLRGDYVTVYYKGLQILRIDGADAFFVDKNYGIDPNGRESWERYFEEAKTALDSYNKTERYEREIQQRLARENNYGGNSAGSDYFIFDIEYTPGANAGRFDALAFCWPTDKRKNGKGLLLAFIEVKVGEKAIYGESSGVSGHYKSAVSFLDELNKNGKEKEAFLNDIDKLIGQLRLLGLLKIGTAIPSKENPHPVTISRTGKPQLIFALANYSPNATRLHRELESIREYNEKLNTEIPFELLFATSSCIGYALYRKCMLGIDDFEKRLAWEEIKDQF